MKPTTLTGTNLKTACFAILLALLLPAFVFSQSDTRYDAGMNLPFNEKAGDVNPQTGNITLSVSDMGLPGRAGMNFSFGRAWSLNQSNVFTMLRNQVDGSNNLNSETIEKYNNLGVGWSSGIPYIFFDDSSGAMVTNLFYRGGVYQIDTDGAKTGNLNESNILWYDLLDLRVYESTLVCYDEQYADDYAGADPAVYGLGSLKTNHGVEADVESERSKYVLLLKDNSKYYFREDGRLLMQQDKSGLNRIWYFYNESSKLVLVVDTIGRLIRFSYDSSGNLEYIRWDVDLGIKETGVAPHRETETRSIQYIYESAENYPEVLGLINDVVGYEEPFVLVGVVDSMGNQTRYEYEGGVIEFTYNSLYQVSENAHLLLTGIISMWTPGGNYKSQRRFEYDIPADEMWRKYFYGGYMEYFRINREYNIDRHGREMNDTAYIYHKDGEAGNRNQYQTVIEQGNLNTTYTYSTDDDSNKYNVLDTLRVETEDGFIQLTDFTYNNERMKTLEQVFRSGTKIYEQSYQYDLKGNLKRFTDKMGLVTATIYNDTYSIPEEKSVQLEVDGVTKYYESENTINDLGQVTAQIQYLEQADGSKRPVTVASIEYDQYGNPVSRTDASGNTVYTVYDDEHNTFPVKTWQEVNIASWANGEDVHTNWLSRPDGTKKVRIRSWKVFNSDGSVWIEVDNEGYAIEHYYDENRVEIETVTPDEDDVTDFAIPVDAGDPLGEDFDDFSLSTWFNSFLTSRQNNPGSRMEIHYQDDFIKTEADIDVDAGTIKMTGIQQDGLGHTEEEIEYNAVTGLPFALKKMTYDPLGRMIGLTDPDAGAVSTPVKVNGTTVDRYDKTWIVKYDDLGRQIKVLYPVTEPGRNHIKQINYNDRENSITTIDPEGRRVYERHDWNGNIIEIIAYGDNTSLSSQIQHYTYSYDQLNRKIMFKDPKGYETRYRYDERNFLLEQDYGVTGSDVMEYNDLGQLTKKTDRKGNKIEFTYDEMGRNTSVIHYAAEEPGVISRQVDTVYDNRGNAVRISNENLIEHYIYNYSNLVTSLERRIKDQNVRNDIISVWGGNESDQVLAFEYNYNDAGMVTSMIYPDGSVHTFDYEAELGRLSEIGEGPDSGSVIPFVEDFEYNKSGVVTKMEYANDTSQEWEFDNRKRISHIKIAHLTETIENLAYILNGSGDILSINENDYTYDGFNRITGAKTLIPGNTDTIKLVTKHFGTYQAGGDIDGEIYEPLADLNSDLRINGKDLILASQQMSEETYDIENFEYDVNGNRTKLMQNGDEYSYKYGERNRLEQIKRKKQGELTYTLYIEYEYDKNGNTTKRTIHKDVENEVIDFEYDTMNRLIRTIEGEEITEYFYDNAGNRLIKKGPDGTTIYLRHGQISVAMDIEINVDQTTDKGKKNRYVLSGDLIAGRITTIVHAVGDPTVEKSWYHLDHLNSTKCVTDESGEIVVNYVYRAFGEQLKRLDNTGADTDDKAKYSYGGKELDDGTNLYYFNARFYDPAIGRFVSLDPVKSGANWYTYCENNPLRYVDKTGLFGQHTTQEDCENYYDDYQGRNNSGYTGSDWSQGLQNYHDYLASIDVWDTTKWKTDFQEYDDYLTTAEKIRRYIIKKGITDITDIANALENDPELNELVMELKEEAIEYQRMRGITNFVISCGEIGLGIVFGVTISPALGVSLFFIGVQNIGYSLNDWVNAESGRIIKSPSGPLPCFTFYFDIPGDICDQYNEIMK